METEIQTIERLIGQGYSDEKLFKMFPKHIDHIKSYRRFLKKAVIRDGEGKEIAVIKIY